MQRLRISGIKHSGALCLIKLSGALGPPLTALLRDLAGARANLSMLLVQPGPEGQDQVCLLLEPEAGGRALELTRAVCARWGLSAPELVGEVAALTLYPSARRLSLPALLAAGLRKRQVSLLTLSASLSAAVAVVPWVQMARALEALGRIFELPPEASPAHARVRVVQKPDIGFSPPPRTRDQGD